MDNATRMNLMARAITPLACLAFIAMGLFACRQQTPEPEVPARSKTMSGGLGILNYTDEATDEVYVDGSWASGVTAHNSTMGAGSASVPRKWDPDYTLKVVWTTSCPYPECDKPPVKHERQVRPEPYQVYGNGGIAMIWVAFFPGDIVKVYPTRVDIGHKDFPDDLKYPKQVCKVVDLCNPLCYDRERRNKKSSFPDACQNDKRVMSLRDE